MIYLFDGTFYTQAASALVGLKLDATGVSRIELSADRASRPCRACLPPLPGICRYLYCCVLDNTPLRSLLSVLYRNNNIWHCDFQSRKSTGLWRKKGKVETCVFAVMFVVLRL